MSERTYEAVVLFVLGLLVVASSVYLASLWSPNL